MTIECGLNGEYIAGGFKEGYWDAEPMLMLLVLF